MQGEDSTSRFSCTLARTAEQIRTARFQSMPTYEFPELVYSSAPPGDWGELGQEARVLLSSDYPPVALEKDPKIDR